MCTLSQKEGSRECQGKQTHNGYFYFDRFSSLPPKLTHYLRYCSMPSRYVHVTIKWTCSQSYTLFPFFKLNPCVNNKFSWILSDICDLNGASWNTPPHFSFQVPPTFSHFGTHAACVAPTDTIEMGARDPQKALNTCVSLLLRAV